MVIERDKSTCILCGASPLSDLSVELHVDHIYPSIKYGDNDLFNYGTMCAPCNLGKHDIIMVNIEYYRNIIKQRTTEYLEKRQQIEENTVTNATAPSST